MFLWRIAVVLMKKGLGNFRHRFVKFFYFGKKMLDNAEKLVIFDKNRLLSNRVDTIPFTFLGGSMMRNAAVILGVLCLIGVAQADLVINGADPGAAWAGWMNVFELDQTYLWGSAWGAADLRATFDDNGVLTLAPNTNVWNPEDAYWVKPDNTGNKIMEANFMQEFGGGALAGQTVTFNYIVGTHTLSDDYTARAFIKVLDPDAGWATVQYEWLELTPGPGSLSLAIDNIANAHTQIGFSLMGVPVDPAGPAAATGVTIIPEPASLALLALGTVLLRRRM